MSLQQHVTLLLNSRTRTKKTHAKGPFPCSEYHWMLMSTNRHKKIANTHYIVRTCMQTRINIGHSMVPPHQMVMSCGTNPRALRSVERPATLRKSLTDGRVQQTERFFFKVRKLLTDDTSHNPEVDFDVSYFVFLIFRHSSCQQKCPPQIRGNTWSLKIWSPIGHHFGRQIPQ